MNYYTIKEASELSGLPKSTLRFYEKIGLIKPIDRDNSSKQRVYNQDDINLIISLSCLSATGLSIGEIKEYTSNIGGGAASIKNQIELLEKQKHRLLREITKTKLRERYVNLKIDYWKAVAKKNKKEIDAITEKATKMAKDLRK